MPYKSFIRSISDGMTDISLENDLWITAALVPFLVSFLLDTPKCMILPELKSSLYFCVRVQS